MAGTRVFIVEDEPLILFTLEDMLADLGCEVVASAMRVSDALGKAQALTFDIAILDVNIAGDRVDPVADLLAERGLPFVFATGYGPSAAPERHRERVVVVQALPHARPAGGAVGFPARTRVMARPGDGRATGSYSAAAHLIALAGIVALPLLLLVGILLYRSVSLEDEQTKQRISQVLEGLVADVDRDFDRRVAVLETLSTSPLLAREDWPAFYRQAKESLQGRAYLVVVDIEGRQLVNTYVPFGQAPAMTGNPATLERMRETGRPVVSDLFTSLVVKQPVYSIAIPVRRGEACASS